MRAVSEVTLFGFEGKPNGTPTPFVGSLVLTHPNGACSLGEKCAMPIAKVSEPAKDWRCFETTAIQAKGSFKTPGAT